MDSINEVKMTKIEDIGYT